MYKMGSFTIKLKFRIIERFVCAKSLLYVNVVQDGNIVMYTVGEHNHAVDVVKARQVVKNTKQQAADTHDEAIKYESCQQIMTDDAVAGCLHGGCLGSDQCGGWFSWLVCRRQIDVNRLTAGD